MLLFLIYFINIGLAANYDPPYANSEHHDAMNIYSTLMYQQQQQQPRHNGVQIKQNLQGNSNYQQLYRYYYTPPSYHQQQQQQQQQQQIVPTQLWSGPPIVVEDNASQQSTAKVNQPTSTTIAFYRQQQQQLQQHTPTNNENTLSLAHHRNSYTQAIPQLDYKNYHNNYNYNYNNNNNNNNIVYHRDVRPQIASIPDADEHVQQDGNINWHERQRQQHQPSQVEEQQQQPQQYYATNTNLHSKRISNNVRKNDLSDYSEHFRRYLVNNPHRIKPIY